MLHGFLNTTVPLGGLEPGPRKGWLQDGTGRAAPCELERWHFALGCLWDTGILATDVFGLISITPGRPECAERTESGEGLQDCRTLLMPSVFLMEMTEIISAHFRDRVRLAE